MHDAHEEMNGEASIDDQFLVHDMEHEVAQSMRQHEIERAMRAAGSLVEATRLARLVITLLAERQNNERENVA